jgi:hypothetical protein
VNKKFLMALVLASVVAGGIYGASVFLQNNGVSNVEAPTETPTQTPTINETEAEPEKPLLHVYDLTSFDEGKVKFHIQNLGNVSATSVAVSLSVYYPNYNVEEAEFRNLNTNETVIFHPGKGIRLWVNVTIPLLQAKEANAFTADPWGDNYAVQFNGLPPAVWNETEFKYLAFINGEWLYLHGWSGGGLYTSDWYKIANSEVIVTCAENVTETFHFH